MLDTQDRTDLVKALTEALGTTQVLTGKDAERFGHEWTGLYPSVPLAVARPANTAEVSATVRIAAEAGIPIVPVSGNTGLCGGTKAPGALMLSLERMNSVREVRPDARVAVVEAGVILDNLHAAADAHDLIFPLTFGARGSAMIGGCLSTNAGGSNVLRYGSTRSLCLGLEVVLADGEVLDLMGALHKDNSGYDLRDLFIGAEGTLGIITAATVKLFPKPAAYATAMVALRALPDALLLLNKLQRTTGGSVEAFEFLPGHTIDATVAMFNDLRAPFDQTHEINILVEVGATAPRDAEQTEDGTLAVVAALQETLAQMLETGEVVDAVVAQNQAQRAAMWRMREVHAEVAFANPPVVNTDVAVPLDRADDFLTEIRSRLATIDPGFDEQVVAHLGDGNIHYTGLPTRDDPALKDRYMQEIEDVALSLGGSFSAEHGIGLSKLPSMRRRKNPVALAVMRGIKTALDPKNIMNPGKVLPD